MIAGVLLTVVNIETLFAKSNTWLQTELLAGLGVLACFSKKRLL